MLWPYHTKDNKTRKTSTVKINKMTIPQIRIFVLTSTNAIVRATW